MAPERLVFQGWELDALARELRVEGQPVRLGDRAFDLLSALAARAGQVVGKNELLDRVWPGRVVEENNLSVQIAALRRVLGADTVQNVAGVGYRLAALPIDAAQADASLKPPTPAATTGLIGREQELGYLQTEVGVAQLVTIVGTGGVGKTTLARALMRSLSCSPLAPADGMHWIDLAPLRPGTALLPLVASALGLVSPVGAAPDDTTRAMTTRDALVVLDNCEHLVDEVAAFLAPLLTSAPRLRWLATSQEALRVAGEVPYRLGPLAVPDADAKPTDREASAALALFCRCAETRGARLAWTPEALDVAADLCRRLDGLPLALEIAAARVATAGLDGVRRQLDQQLRLGSGLRGAPSRQHSLLQTYEWSYSLLSPLEQRVFRSLQPFVGGFTADLVQRLIRHLEPADADGAWRALEALQALVDKSLVQAGAPTADGAPRLWLLESARHFAELQLDACSEAAAVRHAHAEALADWMDEARDEHERLRDRDWGRRYAPEHRNVQAALAWACRIDEPELLARLVAAQGLVESFLHTASDLVRLDLPLDRLRVAPVPRRAAALLQLGWAHHQDGSREQATALAAEALADFENLGDARGAYLTLTRLIRMFHGRPGKKTESQAMWERLQRIDADGVSLRARLNFESSSSYLVGQPRSLARMRELQALAERAGYDDIVASCQVNITDELLVQGRDEEVVTEAQALLQRGMTLPRRRALVCHNLALALVRLGRVAEAREPAMALWRALPAQAHMVLDLFAYAAARDGRLEDAALVAGCSAEIRRRRDLHPEVSEAGLIDDTWRQLREGIDASRLRELARAGETLGVEPALRLALGS